MTTNTPIRILVDLRDRTIQKSRIAFGNRIAAIERNSDASSVDSDRIIDKWYQRFDDMESELDKDLAELAGDIPIVQELIKLRGISFTLAAKVVALIDITQCDTISALWRYAGYGVIDGEREKPTKGEKLHYNKRLKTTVYLVATSFLRSNSPYRSVYDNSKDYYQINRPDWTKGHIHNAAMRKMSKIFLSHLWLTWRQLEGLPISDPYIIGHNVHSHILLPVDYGWEEH